MKIDYNQKLKSLSGKELKDNQTNEDLCLKDVCANALLGLFDDERKLEGKEKLRRYQLANKIYGAKEPIELKSEEITLLKTLVSKAYAALISGQVWKILDPAEKAEPEQKEPKKIIPGGN